MTVGIDDIAIYIPRLYIDATDFAKARGLDPVKLQKGLGVSQMAIVDSNQDPERVDPIRLIPDRFAPLNLLFDRFIPEKSELERSAFEN